MSDQHGKKRCGRSEGERGSKPAKRRKGQNKVLTFTTDLALALEDEEIAALLLLQGRLLRRLLRFLHTVGKRGSAYAH